MHSSKGLEADHFIHPRVTTETFGFPSRLSDEPEQQLAMPMGDDYAYAEQRRLFYVTLTRDHMTGMLIKIERKESAFIAELVTEQGIGILDTNGNQMAS